MSITKVFTIIRQYWNYIMFLTSLSLSSWVYFHLDEIQVIWKEVSIVDLLTTRLGSLPIIFLIGSVFIFIISRYWKTVKTSYIDEYVRWFVTVSITTFNSVFYKFVWTIYSCISGNILIDNIINNKFVLVKRFWSREELLNSINTKIRWLNQKASSDVRFTNSEYESLFNNCQGIEDILHNTERLFIEKLQFISCEVPTPVIASSNSGWLTIPSLMSCLNSHWVQVLGAALIAAFGFYIFKIHMTQHHAIQAVAAAGEGIRNTQEQVIGASSMISDINRISNLSVSLASNIIDRNQINWQSALAMMQSLRSTDEDLATKIDNIVRAVQALSNEVDATNALLYYIIGELQKQGILPYVPESALSSAVPAPRFPGQGIRLGGESSSSS